VSWPAWGSEEGLGQTSFARKLLAYWETWRRGLHKKHIGIPIFRLTVTTMRERVGHDWENGRGGGALVLPQQTFLGNQRVIRLSQYH
jgi:hypothetical protein